MEETITVTVQRAMAASGIAPRQVKSGEESKGETMGHRVVSDQ